MNTEQEEVQLVVDASAKMEATGEREGEQEAPVLPVSQLSPPQPRPDGHGDTAEEVQSLSVVLWLWF